MEYEEMSEIRKMIMLSLCLSLSPLGGAFADEKAIPEAVKVSDVQAATSPPAQAKSLSVRMDGSIEVSGLSIMKSPEGEIRPDVIDGIPCFRSTCGNGKPGYVYLLAEEWGKLLKWRGEMKGLELQIRLFDAEPGKLGISYDSSDLKLKRDPYPVGTWRTPDAGDFKLTGDKKWKTASFKLEQAFFNRRLNGGDIRIGNSNAKSAIAWIALVPSQEEGTPKPPVPMRLSVARVSGALSETVNGRQARHVGTFIQDGSAPLLMEAEQATVLQGQDDLLLGFDEKASGKAYTQRMANASWNFTVKTAGRYTFWRRASYLQSYGNWQHNEAIDGKGEYIRDGEKPAPEWQWVKGLSADLSAGDHVFSMDFKGGCRLDLLALLPEGADAPDDKALKSCGKEESQADLWTSSIRPFDVANWGKIEFKSAGELTNVEYSVDGGSTWAKAPGSRDLSSIPCRGGVGVFCDQIWRSYSFCWKSRERGKVDLGSCDQILECFPRVIKPRSLNNESKSQGKWADNHRRQAKRKIKKRRRQIPRIHRENGKMPGV